MDTLTGAGTNAHRTNVMYVQPESYINNQPPAFIPEMRASRLSESLKRLGSEMQTVKPYKSAYRVDPPVRQRPTGDECHNPMQQRTRSVIHLLARADDDLCRPDPETQKVSGFSGFHAQPYII